MWNLFLKSFSKKTSVSSKGKTPPRGQILSISSLRWDAQMEPTCADDGEARVERSRIRSKWQRRPTSLTPAQCHSLHVSSCCVTYLQSLLNYIFMWTCYSWYFFILYYRCIKFSILFYFFIFYSLIENFLLTLVLGHPNSYYCIWSFFMIALSSWAL